jgi:hypothetical protein
MTSVQLTGSDTATPARRYPTLSEMLKAEKGKPAINFTFPAKGEVTEGMFLDLQHPSCVGRVGLYLGFGRNDSEPLFVLRSLQGGCLYEALNEGKYGHVRRAKVWLMDDEENGRKIRTPLLQRCFKEADAETSLVHIQLGTIGENAGDPLWTGVRGGKTVKSTAEAALVSMRKGDAALVFNQDGSVARIVYEALSTSVGKPVETFRYDGADAVAARLVVLRELFAKADEIDDEDRRTSAQARWMHELARMLEVFPEEKTEIIAFIDERAQIGEFIPPVRGHLRKVLGSEAGQYAWLKDKSVPAIALPGWLTDRQGPPASRMAQRQARSNHDQGVRAKMKGNGGGGGNKNGKGK